MELHMQKSRIPPLCKFTHGVEYQFLWSHDTLPCVLILHVNVYL